MKIILPRGITMVKAFVIKNAPAIATGIGITGMVLATVKVAIDDTPKALKLLEEERKKADHILEPVEIVKTTWRCYAWSAVLEVVSIGFIVAGQRASLKRTAALATAYSLSEAAFKEYRDKNIELFGVKKDKEIYGGIAQDKVAENPPVESQIVATGRGHSLCFDPLIGRYFYSSIDRISKVENFLNKRLITEMYVSLNDFYEELGLDTVRLGDKLGWNISTDMISIDFSSVITPQDEPCIVLRYRIEPRADYENLH